MHSKLHSHFLTQVRNTSEVALQHELLKARDAARRAEDRANRALKAKVRGEGKLETLLQRALKAKVRGEGEQGFASQGGVRKSTCVVTCRK